MSIDDPVPSAPEHRRAARSIRDMPVAERPRERLALRGPGGLSAAELIAVVLGTGGAGRSAVDVAQDALARHASVGALARASDVELAVIPGVGAAKAARLAAPSSSAVAQSPTGRSAAGRSAPRATWPNGCSSRWAASSARSCGC
jgi:DNA repair protein RadC